MLSYTNTNPAGHEPFTTPRHSSTAVPLSLCPITVRLWFVPIALDAMTFSHFHARRTRRVYGFMSVSPVSPLPYSWNEKSLWIQERVSCLPYEYCVVYNCSTTVWTRDAPSSAMACVFITIGDAPERHPGGRARYRRVRASGGRRLRWPCCRHNGARADS